MKLYHVREEFLSLWGPDTTPYTIITEDEIARLAEEWETTPEELLDDLEECYRHRISLDNGATWMTAEEAVEDLRNGSDFSGDWETIVDHMDDELREYVHNELGECTEEEFLSRYLELSPDDLIVG